MSYQLKPDILKKVLADNKLRLKLQELWNVRERAMERALQNGSSKVFLPNSLALLESHLGIQKEKLYEEVKI